MKETAPPLVDATAASRIVAAAVSAGALQREAALALAGVGFRGEPIDHALGRRAGRGRRSAETVVRQAERDAAIREAATYASRVRNQAGEIRRKLLRYRTSGWLLDRELKVCPTHREGAMDGALWRALRAVDAVPSESTIRRVLRMG